MERKYDKVFSLLYLNYRLENMSLQFQIYQSILTVPQSNTLSHKLLFFLVLAIAIWWVRNISGLQACQWLAREPDFG